MPLHVYPIVIWSSLSVLSTMNDLPMSIFGKNTITDGANLTGRGENTMRIHANESGPQGWLCNRHRSELEIQNHCISDPWVWSVMGHGCQVQTHPALLCFEWSVLYFQTLAWSPHNLTAEHLKKLSHTTSTPFHPILIATLWVLKYWNGYPGAPGFMDVHPPQIWFFHSFWMLLTHPQIHISSNFPNGTRCGYPPPVPVEASVAWPRGNSWEENHLGLGMNGEKNNTQN